MPYDYPDIGQRFARYRGWLDRNDVFAVKYEDLIGARRRETLADLATFYAAKGNADIDIGMTLDSIEANIDPRQSHTFRQGGAGGWKTAFTPRHKEQMKEVAGRLLIDLGYEESYAW